MVLFKVLSADGKPCNGGSGAYPLPAGKKAGAWTAPIADLSLCNRGYHLTNRPEAWWDHTTGTRRIFLAEHRGKIVVARGDKIAAESVRLVREVTPEWELLPIYPKIAALFMSAWRKKNGPDAQWPAWATSVLSGAYLRGAYLRGAYLRGADLRGADLRGAYLSGAYLSGADLRGAYLRGADLRGADLRGAYLRGAYLSGAYLSGADLSGADLRGAYLSGADLSGAYLSGADLSGADLSGADLRGRSLTLAEWQKELEIDPETGFVSRKTALPW